MTSAHLLGLYTGQPEQRWDGKAPSAIRKAIVDTPLLATPTGFAEDQQADLEVHGGPEKALHHYPAEHYSHWRSAFPGNDSTYQPGGFGENLSTSGFTEADLCMGDIFAAGTARIQISQGRQPCWKLNQHTGNPGLAAAFQKTAKTGWYYRVIEQGTISIGDTVTLIDRPCPDWNLKDVILARFNPRLDPGIAKALSELYELAEPWRNAFAKKAADPNTPEDISRRLPDG